MFVRYSKKQRDKQKRIEFALARADRAFEQRQKALKKRGGKNVSK